MERRNEPTKDCCAVCGASDARTLSTTTLEDGKRVTVCGSHKTAHRRAERMARTIDDLRILLCDRRVATG